MIELDLGKMADLVAALAIGHVKKRTREGRDIHDRPFRPYSAMYRAQLAEGGEGTNVDLSVTGGLLNSVKLLRKDVRKDGFLVRIGPGSSTSPSVHFDGGAAKRTGRRGPAHNILGAWLHYGRGKLPARPWLGLSPQGRREINRAIERRRSGLFKHTKKR